MHRIPALGLTMIAALAFACATPGRRYPVSPEIRGTVRTETGSPVGGRIVLSLRYRDNPRLAETLEAELDEEGRFAFPSVWLAVAGQEYSKRYRIFLRLEGVPGARTLWRSDYSRLQVGEPLELACDVGRPLSEGLPCGIVGGAGAARWLVEAGARDFDRYCTSCHGREGKGDGPVAEALRTKPADLTRIAARREGGFPKAEIAKWIDGRFRTPFHGTREMPVWGVRLAEGYAPDEFAQALVRGRIVNLLAYLETIQVDEEAW